jgi:transposase-like protein
MNMIMPKPRIIVNSHSNRHGKCNSYNISFKIKAVLLYLTTNYTSEDIRRLYGVPPQTFYYWLKLYRKGLLRMEQAFAVRHSNLSHSA